MTQPPVLPVGEYLKVFEASLVRPRKLAAARELIRAARIETPEELLQAMQNLHANITSAALAPYANGLLDIICDLDGALHEGEPELPDVRKVGELDAFTQRSV